LPASNVGQSLRIHQQFLRLVQQEKFLPDDVAEEIKLNPEDPDFSFKDCDVSLLFADLAGYTRISQRMEGRKLHSFMDAAFSPFIKDIKRFSGKLAENPRGDELFAYFEDEDPSTHACNAAKAALAIRDSATLLIEELTGCTERVIMNIGINTGVTSIGMRKVGRKWSPCASGAAVNVAHRICELANDGSILMSAKSAARMHNDFVLEDMGEHSLKNVTNRIRIYRLVSEPGDQTATGR